MSYLIRVKHSCKNWKKTIFAKETASIFLSALGFFWFLIEVLNWAIHNQRVDGWLRSHIMVFLFVSIIWTLHRRLPPASAKERLNGTDVWIEIRIADLFSIKADYVIPVNSSFDTVISDELVSPRSVQGAFTKRFYKNREHLEAELAKALETESICKKRESKVNGKPNQYKIGTVVKVKSNDCSAYLVAIADLNEYGTASSSFENVRLSLDNLWTYIQSRGSTESIAMPILGTGYGRISTPRDKVIREIIQSFIAACSEGSFVKVV